MGGTVRNIMCEQAWAIKELAYGIRDIWDESNDVGYEAKISDTEQELDRILKQLGKYEERFTSFGTKPVLITVDLSQVSHDDDVKITQDCMTKDNILIRFDPRDGRVFWSIDGFVRKLLDW